MGVQKRVSGRQESVVRRPAITATDETAETEGEAEDGRALGRGGGDVSLKGSKLKGCTARTPRTVSALRPSAQLPPLPSPFLPRKG